MGPTWSGNESVLRLFSRAVGSASDKVLYQPTKKVVSKEKTTSLRGVVCVCRQASPLKAMHYKQIPTTCSEELKSHR